MDSEKQTQKSLENHIAEALDVAREENDDRPDARLYELPTRSTQAESPFSDDVSESLVEDAPKIVRRPKFERTRNALVAVAAVAVAIFALHQSSDTPASKEIKSYTDLAQDSAKTPLQPTDTVLVGNILLDPNDSDRNSGSEAVLNNEEVQAFMDKNPDEEAAIKSSAFNLPAVDEYAIVDRDIDSDGDGDAIAVPVESEK